MDGGRDEECWPKMYRHRGGICRRRKIRECKEERKSHREYVRVNALQKRDEDGHILGQIIMLRRVTIDSFGTHDKRHPIDVL